MSRTFTPRSCISWASIPGGWKSLAESVWTSISATGFKRSLPNCIDASSQAIDSDCQACRIALVSDDHLRIRINPACASGVDPDTEVVIGDESDPACLAIAIDRLGGGVDTVRQ